MSALAINKLIGRVLTSSHARTGVLNGHRADVLKEFDLAPDEYSAIMAIRAHTLQEFSVAVEAIYNRQQDPVTALMPEAFSSSESPATPLSISRLRVTHDV